MNFNLLLKGIITGILISIPMGPIGFLCIKRTLTSGKTYGFIAGLGATTADTIFGLIAGLGLTAVSNTLILYQHWLRISGGVFLCCLGVISFFSKTEVSPSSAIKGIKRKGLLGVYLSTFVLTLANPLTILSFGAIFAGLGVGNKIIARNLTAMGLLVGGVILGSAGCWLTTIMLVGSFRAKMDYRKLYWVNRCAGVIIAGFGLVILLFL